MKINIRIFLLISFLIGGSFLIGFYFGNNKLNQSEGEFDFIVDVEVDPDVNWRKGITDETIVKFNILSKDKNENKIVRSSFFWNPVLRDKRYIVYDRGGISEIRSSSTHE